MYRPNSTTINSVLWQASIQHFCYSHSNKQYIYIYIQYCAKAYNWLNRLISDVCGTYIRVSVENEPFWDSKH